MTDQPINQSMPAVRWVKGNDAMSMLIDVFLGGVKSGVASFLVNHQIVDEERAKEMALDLSRRLAEDPLNVEAIRVEVQGILEESLSDVAATRPSIPVAVDENLPAGVYELRTKVGEVLGRFAVGAEAAPLVHAKGLDDTRLCPAGEAGAFATVFWSIVTCPDCLAALPRTCGGPGPCKNPDPHTPPRGCVHWSTSGVPDRHDKPGRGDSE